MVSQTVGAPRRPETEVVADLAERYLTRHQPMNYRLVVHRNAIVRGTNRWLVEVGTANETGEVRSDDLADRIVAANVDLDADFPRFIRLISMVPQPGEVL